MAPHHLCISPRHSRSRSRSLSHHVTSRSRSRSQLVFLVVKSVISRTKYSKSKKRPAKKGRPTRRCSPGGPVPGGRSSSHAGGRGRPRSGDQDEIEIAMRRSNQWQSEVIRGNHTSRAVASTIGTSMRRRASNAVPARIERLASALTNSVRSYCESERARAIRGHQRQSSQSNSPANQATPRARRRAAAPRAPVGR